MNSTYEKTGFYPADILLPQYANMETWAVVACDQFTSQPEYWESAENIVGDDPSTLRLILPEVKLGGENVEADIENINMNMQDYLDGDVFKTCKDAIMYVERVQSDGLVRHGIIGKVDLETYDFTPGNKALIRATEGTVLSRIPPRVKVRENAPIELPHVMLLIDDPDRMVIEPLTDDKSAMEKVYDFELMLGGGHITGYVLSETQKAAVSEALLKLTDAEMMGRKYGMPDSAPLLFAVGDGNHSLATAKQCYENQKAVTPKEDWDKLPSRYALVEIVNNHDDALKFEPIHRLLCGVDGKNVLDAFVKYYSGSVCISGAEINSVKGNEEILARAGITEVTDDAQFIIYHFETESGTLVVPKPERQLAVGTLQMFLDDYLKENPADIDYVHGDEVVTELGKKKGNMSFLLPAMGKEQLFKTVMADGVLPRKTFSMGHAQDKRYYIEARMIK